MITLLLKYIDINTLPFYLFSMILFLWIVIFLITKYKKAHKLNKEKVKADFLLYLTHLDRYYTTNIFITAFFVFLYMTALFGMFLVVRLLYIGYEQQIAIIDISATNTAPIYKMLQILFLFMVFIIFYRKCLSLIFHIHCIRLHIYLTKYHQYSNFIDYISLHNITSAICDFNDYILEYLLEKNLDEERLSFYNECFKHYLKETTKAKMPYWRSICQQNNYLYIFCYCLHTFINNDNRDYHIYRVTKFLQLFPLFIVSVEIFNYKIHYTYYALLFSAAFTLLLQYQNFLAGKCGLTDHGLQEHFYKNSIPYPKIRLELLSKSNVYNPSLYNSHATYARKGSFFHDFDYTWEDSFVNNIHRDTLLEQVQRKSRIAKRLYILLLTFVIINYGTIWCPFMYAILLLMFYVSKKVDIRSIDEKGHRKWTFQMKYFLLFWVLFMIQIYSMWILIFKAHFTFMDTDILWDYGITITKSYSLEEKINYFWRYFEYLMKNTISLEQYEYLQRILTQTNIEYDIAQKETLKDIKQMVYDLYNGYVDIESKQWKLIRQSLIENHDFECNKDYYEWQEKKEAVMSCIKNIVILIVFSKIFDVCVQAYHIITDDYLRTLFIKGILDIIAKLLSK